MTWDEIVNWINQPLVKWQDTELSLASIIRLLILIVFVFIASKLARTTIRKSLRKLPHVESSTGDAISALVYYAILGLGLAWVLSAVGINTTSMAVFTGTLGLGIGLGVQDMAKNFVSGIIMLLSKTIKTGDVISLDDRTGMVEDVGMYSSRMRTVHDAIVIIPNSEILNHSFVNWTQDRPIRMLEIPIGVHYASDLDQVQQLLLEATAQVDRLLADPPARVLLLSYGDSSVNLVTRVWTDEVMYFQRVISAYNLVVWKLFKENGVILPYPQQDVYVKEWPPRPTQKSA